LLVERVYLLSGEAGGRSRCAADKVHRAGGMLYAVAACRDGWWDRLAGAGCGGSASGRGNNSRAFGKQQAAERVAHDLAKMSRERLLPRVETLEKVVRYEAHLSRQLYKAMHELEALQARRMGGSAPLARLDIDGAGD
jgi:hypothetical protein